MPLPSFPFRFAGVERWLRTPAPTLGRDNERVLGQTLGHSASEIRELEAEGVIGTRPSGL
jgi:crotonobetainyl-CoA:carnitine CoA-transferase CaiB-like acyl-CoA transferase